MTDLTYLEAYIAISDVKARYCHALDTKDWVAFADVFAEDLELDTRPAGGPVIKGRDQAVAMVSAALAGAKTAHQVHSPIMTMKDADTADVIWAMQDRVVWGERKPAPNVYGLTGYGQYHETYVRKDGRWRIATQVLIRFHVDNDDEPVR